MEEIMHMQALDNIRQSQEPCYQNDDHDQRKKKTRPLSHVKKEPLLLFIRFDPSPSPQNRLSRLSLPLSVLKARELVSLGRAELRPKPDASRARHKVQDRVGKWDMFGTTQRSMLFCTLFSFPPR